MSSQTGVPAESMKRLAYYVGRASSKDPHPFSDFDDYVRSDDPAR
jgi:hypothetical protein